MNSGRVLAGNDGGTTTTNGVLPMPAIGAMSRMKLKLRFGYSVALTALVETGITIVYPSAAEFTTYSVPMLPPKTGLFSITNCWPRRSDSHCPACITANSTHSCPVRVSRVVPARGKFAAMSALVRQRTNGGRVDTSASCQRELRAPSTERLSVRRSGLHQPSQRLTNMSALPPMARTTTGGEKATKERPEMRRFIRIVALAVALVIPGSAFAQQYPSKPVKIIVPFPPAGVTDIVARLVAQKLSEKLGEQFYIENIAGAGGNLGMGQAARSPGDGYTILFASSSIVVNPTLYSKVPFDIDKDFVPVTKAGATPNSWQVNPDFPASTMTALIDIIRKEPGKYNVASPGTGTTPSLSIEMLRLALGLNFVVVPFAGGGPMVQSLL